MSISGSVVQRDAAGRFLPGQSGNPTGKAPGTRNRSTRLRELLTEGEDHIIGRVLIDKAKAGDAVAARFVIAHLMPRPRSRAIELDLPEGDLCEMQALAGAGWFCGRSGLIMAGSGH
jgi:hypothetical protein